MYKYIFYVAALVLLFINLGFAQAEPDEIVWHKTRYELGLVRIINAVFTSDDLSVIVTDANYKVVEIDGATGEFKREIPNIRGVFRFSDDGQYVYTYDSKKIHYQTGAEIGQFKMNGVPVSGFTEWDINEKAGVLVGVFFHSQQHPTLWSRSIFVFDLNTFQLIDTIGVKDNYYYSVTLSGDGKYFITHSFYNPIPELDTDDKGFSMLWNTKNLDTISEKTGLNRIKFSPDNQWIGSAGVPYIRVFNAETFEMKYEWDPNNGVCANNSVAFTPDSKYLVSRGPNCYTDEDNISKLKVWDLLSGKLAYKYNYLSGQNIYILKDKKILSYSTGGLVLLNWMLPTTVKEINNSSRTVYPNPTSGDISIKSTDFNAGHLKLELTDIKGSSLSILYNRYYQNEELKFDISFLPTGTYFLKAIQNKLVQTYKIIKER